MRERFDEDGNLHLVVERKDPCYRRLAEAVARSRLREDGFTGIDSHGHKWVNGKQVKRDEDSPAAPRQPVRDEQPPPATLDGHQVEFISQDPNKGLVRVKVAGTERVVRVSDLKPGTGQPAAPVADPGTDLLPPSKGLAKMTALGKGVVTGAMDVEHGVKEYLKNQFTKLPVAVQYPVAGFLKLFYGTYVIAQRAVDEVAKEQGFDERTRNRIATVVTAVDAIGMKGNALLGTVVGGPAVGTAASFFPVGSMCYLAFSGATNPAQTLRAAMRAVKAYGKSFKPGSGVTEGFDVKQADIHKLSRHLSMAADQDMWYACFCVDLDQHHDAEHALRAADATQPAEAVRESATATEPLDWQSHPATTKSQVIHHAKTDGGTYYAVSDLAAGKHHLYHDDTGRGYVGARRIGSFPSMGAAKGRAQSLAAGGEDLYEEGELEEAVLQENFTGVITASNGVEYHYVNGVRVPNPHPHSQAGPKVNHPHVSTDTEADKVAAGIKTMGQAIHAVLHDGPRTFKQVVSDMQGGNPTAKYTGKYYNALSSLLKSGAVVKNTDGTFQLAKQSGGGQQAQSSPTAPTQAPAPAPQAPAAPPAPAPSSPPYQDHAKLWALGIDHHRANQLVNSGTVWSEYNTQGGLALGMSFSEFRGAVVDIAVGNYTGSSPAPAQAPAAPSPPTVSNPYTSGSIGHNLYNIIANDSGLSGKQIIAKTGHTGQYSGKFYNALGAMTKKGHIVKNTDGTYSLATSGQQAPAAPTAPAQAPAAAPTAPAKPGKVPKPTVTPVQALAATWSPMKPALGGRENRFTLEPLVAKGLQDLNTTPNDMMKNRNYQHLLNHIRQHTDGSVGTFDLEYAVKNLAAQTTNKVTKPMFNNFGGTNGPSRGAPDESRPTLTTPEKVAAQKYTSTAYKYLNDQLRKDGTAPPQFVDMHHNLQAAFSKVKEFSSPVNVTRGSTMDPQALSDFIGQAKESMSAGKNLGLKGYTSTTVGSATDPFFKGNLTLKIKAVQGLDMKPYSHYPHVSEMLLNHDSQFKVTEVKQVGGGWEVSMEEIPASKRGKAIASSTGTGSSAGSSGPKQFTRPHESQAVDAYLKGTASHSLHSNWAGYGEDTLLRDILKEARRDTAPKDRAGIDDLKAKGWDIAYRGVKGKSHTKQFRTGGLFCGSGIYGNGTYVDIANDSFHNEISAKGSARGYGKHVMRIAIDPSARYVDHSALKKEQTTELAKLRGAHKAGKMSDADYNKMKDVVEDMGRFAALKNYDVIRANNAKYGYHVVLNRSVLAVEDKDQ